MQRDGSWMVVRWNSDWRMWHDDNCKKKMTVSFYPIASKWELYEMRSNHHSNAWCDYTIEQNVLGFWLHFRSTSVFCLHEHRCDDASNDNTTTRQVQLLSVTLVMPMYVYMCLRLSVGINSQFLGHKCEPQKNEATHEVRSRKMTRNISPSHPIQFCVM